MLSSLSKFLHLNPSDEGVPQKQANQDQPQQQQQQQMPAAPGGVPAKTRSTRARTPPASADTTANVLKHLSDSAVVDAYPVGFQMEGDGWKPPQVALSDEREWARGNRTLNGLMWRVVQKAQPVNTNDTANAYPVGSTLHIGISSSEPKLAPGLEWLRTGGRTASGAVYTVVQSGAMHVPAPQETSDDADDANTTAVETSDEPASAEGVQQQPPQILLPPPQIFKNKPATAAPAQASLIDEMRYGGRQRMHLHQPMQPMQPPLPRAMYGGRRRYIPPDMDHNQ